MLTADFALAVVKNGQLSLPPLSTPARNRLLLIAEELVSAFEIGLSMAQIEERLQDDSSEFEPSPREQKIINGFKKVLFDSVDVIAAAHDMAPEDARKQVFTQAAIARKALENVHEFDRTRVLCEALPAIDSQATEHLLFADLPSEHRLTTLPPFDAEGLVRAWEQQRTEAILLHAVSVKATIESKNSEVYRFVFRKLKFHQVLFQIAQTKSGYELLLDGPLSLHESVTRYGLNLVLACRAAMACEQAVFEAKIKWKRALVNFAFQKEYSEKRALEFTLSTDVAQLVEKFEALQSDWRVDKEPKVLALPRGQVCVPDLAFVRKKVRVLLEIFSHASRESVIARIDAIEAKKVEAPLILCVPARLRVSPELLPEGARGAIYVFKQTISARSLLPLLEKFATHRSKQK